TRPAARARPAAGRLGGRARRPPDPGHDPPQRARPAGRGQRPGNAGLHRDPLRRHLEVAPHNGCWLGSPEPRRERGRLRDIRVRSIALVLMICSLASAAHADEPYQPPDFMTELPPLPADVDAGAVWRLDLAEALRLAIHDNLGLAIERQSVQAARLG